MVMVPLLGGLGVSPLWDRTVGMSATVQPFYDTLMADVDEFYGVIPPTWGMYCGLTSPLRSLSKLSPSPSLC